MTFTIPIWLICTLKVIGCVLGIGLIIVIIALAIFGIYALNVFSK